MPLGAILISPEYQSSGLTARRVIRELDYWISLDDESEPLPPDFLRFVADGYARGCANADGEWLRNLADAFELHHDGLARARSQVFRILENCDSWGLPIPPVTPVYEGLLERGFKVSRKTVANWFKFYGVRPLKVKPGPAKGSKQKGQVIRVNPKFGKA
jgi:hypothetical protein